MKNGIPLLVLTSILTLLAMSSESMAQEETGERQEAPEADAEDDAESENGQAGDERSIMEKLFEKITGFGGLPFDFRGRSQEFQGDWTIIRGEAEIVYRDVTILADLIRFNSTSYELEARGNAVLIQQGLRIGGDEMSFNLRQRTGTIINPFLETREGFIVSGSKLVKLDADRYRIEDASLTSCTQPTPYWMLRASSIDIKAGEKATLHNARFNLGKVPVFYTPWMQLPLNNERGSGFLMPTWGTSDFHGTYVNTQYFWAINRSHDSTLGLDYYEKRGWRYSGEYRNNLGNNNFTQVSLFYINDDLVGRSRYDSQVRVRQSLPWGINVAGNMQFLSDREYRRDFVNRDIRYSTIVRKSASLTKSFGLYTFTAAYNDINRFVASNRISEIRYLPTVDFRARERRIFTLPVYYSFSANYTRPAIIDLIRKTKRSGFTARKSDQYDRLDLLGTVKAPIKTFAPWLTITPTFTARDTEYSKSYRPKRDRIVKKPFSRRYYDVGFQVTGPIFSRIYGRPEQFATRYKHVVEPRLTYRWRSNIDRPQRIIVIDHVDNYYKVHEVQWAMDNRFLQKRTSSRRPEGQIVELLKVTLSQYVTLDDNLQTSYNKAFLSDPTIVEISGRFSPLMIDVRTRLSNLLSASAHLEYSVNTNKLVSYTIGTNLNWRSLHYNLGWYKTLKQFVNQAFYRPASNRFVTDGSIDLLDGLISVRGAFDYNFIRKQILNYLAGASINGQCLGLQFEVRRLNILGQEDLQIRWGISIGGLRSLLSTER